MALPGFTAEASIGPFAQANHMPSSNSSFQIAPQVGLPEIPVYGNWCGPNYGSGDTWDAVDAVCKAHDECYRDKGEHHCGCDRALILSMPGAIIDTPTVWGKAAGAEIADIFLRKPCVCQVNTPYPCGVKFCKKWGVPYPCGVNICWHNIPVPGIGGIGPC